MRKCSAKRLLASILAIAMVVTMGNPTAYAAESADPHEGHTNETGAGAISAVAAVSAGEEEPSSELIATDGKECYVHGDVNQDGALTNQDAIYVLQNSMFPELYPLEQDCDYNGNGDVDKEDAIYLLYCSIWPDEVDGWEDGVVHNYGAPTWNWNEDNSAAVAEFVCSCHNQKMVKKLTAEVLEPAITAATCDKAGKTTYTAKVKLAGKEFTGTKEVPIASTGHVFAEEATCTGERACTVCGYKEPAKNHAYVMVSSQKATCEHEATETYECSACQDKHTVVTGNKIDHTLTDALPEVPVPGEKCQYQQRNQCSVCGAVVPGEIVTRHSEKASITKDATCKEKGIKTYTCSDCGKTREVEIDVDPEAHDWDGGTASGTVITYYCKRCAATKTAVNASSATISNSELKAASELAVENNVTIALDDSAKNGVKGDNIQVSAKVLSDEEKASLSVAGADMKNMGEIYDFTMQAGDDTISKFGGTVTIRLPYTLQEGEDVDCIDVCYINDNGELEYKRGTYSNGYVTFTTDHFSYYTVTRLSAAERCEKYGHNDATKVIAPTCDSDGYTIHSCARCLKSWQDTKVDMHGHDYEITESHATCTETGNITKKCKNCDKTFTTEIPATGHQWIKHILNEASCVAVGKNQYMCHNCDISYEEVCPMLKHNMEKIVVKATCEERGYEINKCKHKQCGYKEVISETEATGHELVPTWKWSKDNSVATLTLTCSNEGCKFKHEKETVIVEENVEPTCTQDGHTGYVAKYYYNGKEYQDGKEVSEKALGHVEPSAWEMNGKQHFRTCERCGEKLNAGDHTWGEDFDVTPATCGEEGSASHRCTLCKYQETKTLPKTGSHDYVNGVCKDCGAKSDECTHEDYHVSETIDLKDYGFCGGFENIYRCDCGEKWYSLLEESECNLVQVEEKDGYSRFECSVCGGTITHRWTSEKIEGCEYHWTSTVTFADKTGNRKKVLEASYDGWEHNYGMATFEIAEGASCEDGYTVTRSCRDCGFVDVDHVDSDEMHWTYWVDEIDLSKYGLCDGTAQIYRCACGEIESYEVESTCNWKSNYDDQYGFKDSCDTCGFSRIPRRTEGEKDDKCRIFTTVSMIYMDADGKEAFKLTNAEFEEHHSYLFTYDIEDGASCEDGCTVTATCKDCGDVFSYTEFEHQIHPVETIDLAQMGMCGGQIFRGSCACGQEGWESLYEPEVNVTVHVKAPEDWETPRLWAWRWFEETGEYGGVFDSWPGEVLEPDEDGWVSMEIPGWVNYVIVNGNDGTVQTVVIPVEMRKDIWLEVRDSEDYTVTYGDLKDDACLWILKSRDSKSDFYECAICGAKKYMDFRKGKKDKDCQYTGEMIYTLIDKSGRNVVTATERWEGVEHNFGPETYEIETGASCEDGYYVISKCADCGYEEKQYCIEHYIHVVERIDLSEYGFCGGYVVKEACPCGEYEYVWTQDENCDWCWRNYDEEQGTQVYECSVCGGIQTYKTEYGEKDANCNAVITRTHTYIAKGSDETITMTAAEWRTNHNYGSAEFEIAEGASCVDGYYVTRTCQDCHYENREYESGYHYNYVVEYIDLSAYGLCGGYDKKYSCACGEYQWMESENVCDWEYTGEDKDTGAIVVVCRNCGATRSSLRKEGPKDENCEYVLEESYTYKDKTGTKEKTIAYKWRFTHHNYGSAEFEIAEGASCEEGYHVTLTCQDCGYTAREWRDWHCPELVRSINFAEYGGCEESAYEYRCACGQEAYWLTPGCLDPWGGRDWTDEDGREHFVLTGTCNEGSGLTWIQDSYSVRDANTCTSVTFTEHTIRVGNKLADQFTTKRINTEVHNNEITYTLVEGATSCEDGVIVTATCIDCGCVNTYQAHAHVTQEVVEKIDLSQYGAVCGGYLVKKVCPCGQTQKMEFMNSKCDLDRKDCEMWIRDTVSGDYYDETGCSYLDQTSRIMTCAVTDPIDCGLKIRYAKYWLATENPCIVEQYETWQLGYNEQTGTYQKEVTCFTGERRTYHNNYEGTWEEEAWENGTVRIASHVCPDCGTSLIWKNYYNTEDELTKYERIGTNMLDIGTYKSDYYLEEYVSYAGHLYPLKEYSEYVYMDGSECWYRYDHVYDWENASCKRVTTYSESGGYTDTYIADCHVEYRDYGSVKQPTCTQFGEIKRVNKCRVCGEIIWEETEVLEPTCHDWYYNFDKGCYCCDDCGLENANGASGGIVMADLSNETDYVVGYWNRNDIEVGYRVSVLKKTPTVTIHVKVPEWWNQPGLWAWYYEEGDISSKNLYGTWPGKAFEEGADGWLTIEVPTWICGIVVNGNYGNFQTVDIPVEEGKDIWLEIRSGDDYTLTYGTETVQADPEEDPEIFLDGIEFTVLTAETDDITAISFSKAAVEQAAAIAVAEAGYTGEYDIRFAFVPLNGGDELDYAITFTNDAIN